MSEIRVDVDGYPPAKGEAMSMLGPGHSHAPRVLKLLEEARHALDAFGGTGLGSVPIGLQMELRCPRNHLRGDATNYLGGVADVLEDKTHRQNLNHLGGLAAVALYENDRQIETVSYSWVEGDRPSYGLRIWTLDPSPKGQSDHGAVAATPSSGKWERDDLENAGFAGWTPLLALRDDRQRVPHTGGVYIIWLDSLEPNFLGRSSGGHFKGKDPTVPRASLEANWVPKSSVLYIGKANDLNRRLHQFARFGDGDPIAHWGGRLIWQLAEPTNLLIAWKETPGKVPLEEEAGLIAAFRSEFGKPPFANNPDRLGS